VYFLKLYVVYQNCPQEKKKADPQGTSLHYLNHNILFAINMPSGWKTGTHKSVQRLNVLALKSLLELLLSVCVGFRNHP